MSLPDNEILQINHYFTKSEGEFATRAARGWHKYGVLKMQDKQARFDKINKSAGHDTAIDRFIPAVRRRLGNAEIPGVR